MGNLDNGVLIVEDDDLAASAIRSGVTVAGYSVCGAATSVEEAIALTRQHRPSLAIIDVDLGAGGSGIEAARQMLRIGPIAIIYVTGRPLLARDADVGHGWLPKPYRLLDLINALRVVRFASARAPIVTPVPAELRLLPQRAPRIPRPPTA